MRSRTSRGVPEWSGGKDLYMGSPVSGIGTSFGVIGIVPGPPEGSRGSTGWGHLSRRAPWAESGREPAPSGLGAPPWASPHAPRVGNPRGGVPPCLGGQGTPSPPLGRRPPGSDLQGPVPPQGAYIKGGKGREGIRTSSLGASLSPATPLPLAEARRSPAAITAASTTTPSCCWISINLSFPLAGSRRRRRRCTVRVLNAEVPSVRHSVIGDLDHDEYDSINPVLLNASA